MSFRRLALALAAVVILPLAMDGGLNRVRAADPAPESSLKFIPADASFYSTSLNLGEQMETFLKSNACAKLRALPATQLAIEHFHAAAGKSDNPVGQLMQMLKDPANIELAALLADMPRREIFVYGGPTWARLMPIFQDVNWAVQFAPFKALLSGQDPGKSQGRAILGILNAAADKIEFPELIVGFELSSPAPAVAQIKRLEGLLTKMLANDQRFKGRLKRTKVSGADALTFTVDGSMFPVDQIPWSDIEKDDGEYQKLRVRLKTLTLTVALLVKDNYLMLTVGPHAGTAEALGRGPALPTRPELAPLAKHAHHKLTSVAYFSKALAVGSSTSGDNLLGALDLIKDGLDKLPLSEQRRAGIEKDFKRLLTEVTAALPKPGATLGLSFLSDRGQETYVYNYGKSPGTPAAKPLTILDHLGGSPLIALAGAVDDPTPGYRYLVSWLKIIYGHLDGVAKELAPEAGYQQFQQSMDMILPFLKRFDDITGNQLLPAFGAGETAIVFDAKWTSIQWYKDFDQKGESLPMLEFGVLRTTKDSAKLLKAFQAYRELINDVMVKANEAGANMPEGGLPKPQSKKADGAMMYFWPLPPAGQDAEIQPNVGLSDKLLALSLSFNHTGRLMKQTPPAAAGPLSEKRPVISAAVVDFAGLVRTARPWVEQFALPVALEQMPDNAIPGIAKKDLPAQVKTILDVLGCLRKYTSITYSEGDATVTHGEMTIQDLK